MRLGIKGAKTRLEEEVQVEEHKVMKVEERIWDKGWGGAGTEVVRVRSERVVVGKSRGA